MPFFRNLSKQVATKSGGLALAGLAFGAGLLEDAHCEFWSRFLPNFYYAGIVVVGFSFGLWPGVGAAALAGICHAVILSFLCAPTGWIPGELLGFVLVGLLAGALGRRSTGTTPAGGEQRPLEAAPAARHSAPAPMAPGIVHQFRTPLSSIEGAGFMLQDATLPEEQRQEFIGIILKECRRLDLLVGLLDFTQPRSSECLEVDVSAMLDDVVLSSTPMAKASGITLRKEAVPRLRLLCDHELITQAITNLMVNAIDAMPRGGEIRLSASAHGTGVMIGVRDQRCSDCQGADSGGSSRHDKHEGEVDLIVAQQIIMRHGGVLQVERNPDAGITVSMILPAGSSIPI